MTNIIKFTLLLVFEIPAICISIFIFFYLLINPLIRSTSKNHIWIILLIFNFIQLLVLMPMPISFYYLERIWPTTNTYCVWWNWFEYSSNTAGVILMAWASIERYFFIFYPRFLSGKWWKIYIFHFIPILLCILWPSSWYFAVTVISPDCINVWNFDQVICGVPCFTAVHGGILGVLHLLLNIMIPVMIIITTNITLIIHVIRKKLARHQVMNWRRHRKMVLQLWFISSLYLAGWVPLTLTGLIQFTGHPTFMLEYLSTIYFALYFIPLFVPIFYLFLFPHVIRTTREFIQRRITNRVATAIP